MEAIGKNGIYPPRLAPAVILRPGDAGFAAATSKEVGVQKSVKVTKSTRQCFFCGKEYQPSGNRQKRCAECAGKVKPGTKPEAKPVSAVASAITNLRQKAGGKSGVTVDLRALAAKHRLIADQLDASANLIETVSA